ncbi:MAG: histidine kinase N-terminal domain-containing protein, partial [Caldilineales bacterium]|nr:histidine kinase N-terminal domain-containing protein [Caldilineales bacterium]
MVPSYWQSDDSLWEQYLDRLSEADRALLQRVRAALPLAADVSRSDVFLVIPDRPDRFCIVLHARPHSMATL